MTDPMTTDPAAPVRISYRGTVMQAAQDAQLAAEGMRESYPCRERAARRAEALYALAALLDEAQQLAKRPLRCECGECQLVHKLAAGFQRRPAEGK